MEYDINIKKEKKIDDVKVTFLKFAFECYLNKFPEHI